LNARACEKCVVGTEVQTSNYFLRTGSLTNIGISDMLGTQMLDKFLIQANTRGGFLHMKGVTRVNSILSDAKAMIST